MRQAWKTWILKSRKIPESCLEKFKTKKIQHYFVSRPEDGWNKRSNMSNKRKLKKLRKLKLLVLREKLIEEELLEDEKNENWDSIFFKFW